MNRRDIEHNGVRFTLTELGNYGYSIGVRKWREAYDKNHFIVKTVTRPFNKSYYSFAHTPIVIADIYDTNKFSRREDIRVLDMPIKFPGSNDYRIPRELGQFDETIAKIVSFEHEINPEVKNYFAYLTVDQGGILPKTYPRRSGLHVDGLQGARILRKRPVNRSYIVYDHIPTVFYAQSFKTEHLDEALHNFFLSFEEQADITSEITFDPYQILCMNAYTVHRSDITMYPIYRTFLRVSYDLGIYDRFGNTHNPQFSYNWNMVTRDTPKHLTFKPLKKHHPDAY